MKCPSQADFAELSCYLTARQYVALAMMGGFYGTRLTVTEAAEVLTVSRSSLSRVYNGALRAIASPKLGKQLRPTRSRISLKAFLESRDNSWLLKLLDHGIEASEVRRLADKVHTQLAEYVVQRISMTPRAMWLKYTWARSPRIASEAVLSLQAAKYPAFVQAPAWRLPVSSWDRRKRISFCAIKRESGDAWDVVKAGVGSARATRAISEFNLLRLRLEMIALKKLGVPVKIMSVSRTKDALKVEVLDHDSLLVPLSAI